MGIHEFTSFLNGFPIASTKLLWFLRSTYLDIPKLGFSCQHISSELASKVIPELFHILLSESIKNKGGARKKLNYKTDKTVTPANSLKKFVSGVSFQSFPQLSKGSQSRGPWGPHIDQLWDAGFP